MTSDLSLNRGRWWSSIDVTSSRSMWDHRENCVMSRSGIYEQHQGLDAIIEEVNKALKALIPSVPQYHH